MYLEMIYVDCGIHRLYCWNSLVDMFQNMLVDLYAECGEAHEEWIIFKGLFAQDMCYENMSMVRKH